MKSGKADVRRATIINDCWLWAGFLDWDFYWVSSFSIFLIFPPSLSFCLPQCPFSFPLPMAKWFHSFYTMGNWSLLQTEAAFKNVQNLARVVGRKTALHAYDKKFWEECLSTLWLEANYPYLPAIFRGTICSCLFKDIFIFLGSTY